MDVFKKSIIYSLCFTFLFVGGFLFWKKQTTQAVDGKALSADELLERTMTTNEITTNLLSENFVRAKFSVQLDSEKSKKEAEKVQSIVESEIIKILSQSTRENLKGNEGITRLEANIKEQLNHTVPEGKVEKVYATELLVQ
jgi:flagellar FliL protein